MVDVPNRSALNHAPTEWRRAVIALSELSVARDAAKLADPLTVLAAEDRQWRAAREVLIAMLALRQAGLMPRITELLAAER